MLNKWCTVSPVIDPRISGKVSLPIVWGDRVQFNALPDWLWQENVAGGLSYWQRARLNQCSFALIKYYEAGELGIPDPEWQDTEPRSLQETAVEHLNFVILSSWLAQPSPMTFELVIHAQDSGNGDPRWLIRELAQVTRTKPDPLSEDTELTQEDIFKSSALFEQIETLPREGAVWTALFTLLKALQEHSFGDLRILLFWIAIEALFGPEDAREIRHRLAERVALFLAPQGSKARTLYRETKKGYDLRSKIAHGLKVGDLDPETRAIRMHEVQELLRMSLNKIISSKFLLDIFNGKNRERFLDELAFSSCENDRTTEVNS